MTNAAEKTEQYFRQVKLAKTDAERQRMGADYRAYYAQLTDEEKTQADKIRRVHFDALKQKLDDFEPEFQRMNDILNAKLTARTSESAARQ